MAKAIALEDEPGGRCGYGPRIPLLIISPYAKKNYVSHFLADQSSILCFIEDNCLKEQRISKISFDRFAGTLNDLFDFTKPNMQKLILDPYTGLAEINKWMNSADINSASAWTAAEDCNGRQVSSSIIHLNDHSTTVLDTGGNGLPMVLLHGVGFDCWIMI